MSDVSDDPPRRQRLAAYVVLRRDGRADGRADGELLLARIATHIHDDLWTLPGGGLEHGEDPRDAVVREVHEETGLAVEIGETAHVYSAHSRNAWRHGRRADAHALRIVYEAAQVVPIPVVAIGGVTSLADVLDFLAVGAVAVQVGTAIFNDPLAPVRVRDELAAELAARGYASVREAVGAAHQR